VFIPVVCKTVQPDGIFALILFQIMYMKKMLLFLFVLSAGLRSLADEGMWLPLFLEQLNEKEMNAMGMKISARDIYDVNKGSLKDAVLIFGGGCTGEVVSPKGLIFTNHHCGYGSIQRLTSLTYNYLRDGFWAKNISEELPCPGLTVTFIVRMEDVSAKVLNGVAKEMGEAERQSVIDRNINEVKQKAEKNADEDIVIRPFYNGNQYFMFITLTYKDIRLAGAPPSSIGAFGADTDNWVWPRHGGDFSVFRIYSNRANRPADYSSSNIPYTPKKFLPISIDGMQEGDFTMVFGFPGRTNEYLPSNAVNLTANVLNPARIAMRDATLKTMKDFMQHDEQIKIQYASKYSGIANQWKKMIGETQGINFSRAIEKKWAYEKDYTVRINKNPLLKSEYGGLLEKLNALHRDIEPYALVRDYFSELTSNTEVLSQALAFNNMVQAFSNNGQKGWDKEKANLNDKLAGFFKDYQPRVDQKILAALMNIYMRKVEEKYIGQQAADLWNDNGKNGTQLAAEVFARSAFVSEEKTRALLNLPTAEAIKKIMEDIAYRLLSGLGEGYNSEATPMLAQMQPQINALQRSYMQAQLKAFPQKRFYPDANGTLRLTYGKVRGFRPRDGVEYGYYTYLDGVMEKYVPGDYEFDVPSKLIDLYKKKDFGQYGENGRMPVAFIGANHTTGGNSGSPAIDAYGNLVGLNFDRVWEGTMSDLNYDVNICRNIMVDVRYVLFVIDKLGGASNLVKEMTLVHPKKK
jgi:hypothetical protein